MTSQHGQRISFYDMAGIFGTAFLRTSTPDKAINGFWACGLWPFDDTIFQDNEFAAAAVTEERTSNLQSGAATTPRQSLFVGELVRGRLNLRRASRRLQTNGVWWKRPTTKKEEHRLHEQCTPGYTSSAHQATTGSSGSAGENPRFNKSKRDMFLPGQLRAIARPPHVLRMASRMSAWLCSECTRMTRFLSFMQMSSPGMRGRELRGVYTSPEAQSMYDIRYVRQRTLKSLAIMSPLGSMFVHEGAERRVTWRQAVRAEVIATSIGIWLQRYPVNPVRRRRQCCTRRRPANCLSS
ncbi:hypothetical protein LSAT2_003891 [Lamellibrachia satsuma]|nr:hypothetical protein LSAT2_003891 [Lamellibrachia satsuma]